MRIHGGTPRLFQVSFVIGEDMFSIQYSLVLMYLHYEYKITFSNEIGRLS